MNVKKKYFKPDVELVDFSLSSSIAGECKELDEGIPDNMLSDGDFKICYDGPHGDIAVQTS